MAKQTTNLSSIAKELNLSMATVSYVLNGKSRQLKIAPETAEKVISTAHRLGYRTNFWAKLLNRQKSNLIGILFPDIRGSAAHQMTEGINEVLAQNNFESILAVNFWKPHQERREVELMLEKRVEGIIALPQAGSTETYNLAVNAGCPVVFIGDYLPGISASSVTLDSIDCIDKVLQHLYETGRRNIRLLAVDYKSKTLLEREEAFRNGLKRLGLPLYSDSIVYAELAKEASVFERVKQIIESQKGADAILGISDAVALVALSILNRMGVKVPDHVAVAGIANLLYANYPLLGLTTVDECCHELGRRAATLMLQQIDQAIHENIQYEHIRLKGPLIIRQSTSGIVEMI